MIELPMEYKSSLRKYLTAEFRASENVRLESYSLVKITNALIEDIVNEIAIHHNIYYLDTYSRFMDNGKVKAFANGHLLYSDHHHLNDYGASYLVETMLSPIVDHVFATKKGYMQ